MMGVGEGAGGRRAWIGPGCGTVGRIPYLAWNWDLASHVEKKQRNKCKEVSAGLAFIPAPHSSPMDRASLTSIDARLASIEVRVKSLSCDRN